MEFSLFSSKDKKYMNLNQIAKHHSSQKLIKLEKNATRLLSTESSRKSLDAPWKSLL